ncbi:MAG: CPBP family intramembrane metalloprotease [Clostridia bacterium]|nr:CPBP family intramembrane metalloprotease [Clostridia bacterium]
MNDYIPQLPQEQEELPLARDLRQERRQLSILALAVTYIFAAVLVLQLLAVLCIELFAPHWMSADWYVMVVSNTCMYLVMPTSLFLFRMAPKQAPKQTRRIGFWAFCGLIALCFSISLLGNLAGNFVNEIISTFTGKEPTNELTELTLNSPFWATLLYCGILAPIMEEIFYRKLVIDRLRRYGDLPAILISGVTFGLIHGNFNQFFYAAAIGLLFGYVYLYTGKLRYTVALHAIFNLISGVGVSELLKHLDLAALETQGVEAVLNNPVPFLLLIGYYLFLGLCFVCAPIAIALLWKYVRFEKAAQPLTARQWASVTLKNPGVWVLAAMLVFLFVS